MIAWPSPFIPAVPGSGRPLRIHDTASGQQREVTPTDGHARIYVCGITPYDATHMGHAATYVTFDLVGRVLRDAGHRVTYVQNVTDVDDPLFERAQRDGISWETLGRRETALFREDMTALQVISPDHYVGAVEAVPEIVTAVQKLVGSGAAYGVPVPSSEGGEPREDWYFDATAQEHFGGISHLGRDEMLTVFAERGGDPHREGKRHPLDPLLWRATREGEPAWDGGSLGAGRPGWHIECTVIALEHLGLPFDLQGGGDDLIFPHHEMSALHGEALRGEAPFARTYVHQAMVGLDGAKMSKSKGNLVLVSKLRREGVDPMAIRLGLLAHHYRTSWDWSEGVLTTAQARLARWREALSTDGGPSSEEVVEQVRERVADDLDTAGALEAVDAWATTALEQGGDDRGAPGVLARALDALLGIRV
ncbi:MAG: cysteine--1-D-myo-inosityl 2-amino-2-deoxy-alpha-D-glucopyranoside ligase [Actinomycetota bacterium]|nr:cysteine--1-D-myo-inosityl 2-amino-2-deoxy-alpha-D-glucopyranoside ligase [Actinomycetota bacterium]